MAAYAYPPGFAQRRAVVFFAIVGVHVLLIYAFASGLAMKAVEMIAPPIDTTIIDEEVELDEPPPPPPPEFERPPVQIVAPEIAITMPVDAPPPPITNVTTRPAPPPVITPPAPGTKLARISGPNTEDYYPSISRNAGEEGRPMVKVCIGANGRLESAEVGETSGFPRLDEAAVRVAKASRYKAATEAGKAIAQCANLPIRFSLNKTP
jgi:periplasmic protein TonB